MTKLPDNVRAAIEFFDAIEESIGGENDHWQTIRDYLVRQEANAARYKWLANRVLACDYGDNDAPGEQIGWRIMHNLLARNGERQPAFMFGASIDSAIDAAMLAAAAREG